MMKIGAKEVPQGIDDMKRKHHCLHQLSRKIPGCKIRGMKHKTMSSTLAFEAKFCQNISSSVGEGPKVGFFLTNLVKIFLVL
jgi:hypothetical protein